MRFINSLLFLLICQFIFGQNQLTNERLIELAEKAKVINSDSTVIYLDLITLESSPTQKFQENIIRGQFYRDRRSFDRSIELFEEAKKVATEIDNEKYKAIAGDEMSIVLGMQGKYDEAFSLSEQALNTFKDLNDSSAITKCLLGIARLFIARNDYESGNQYTEDAIKFANEPQNKAFALANKGIYLKHQNKFDSARYYYQKGIEMYDKDPAFLMRSYYNLALLEKQLKNIPEALAYYDKAIDILKEMKDTAFVAVLEVNRTFIYYDLKDYEEAKRVLDQHASTIIEKGTIQNKLDFWLIRYNISEKLGLASDALSHYRSYRKIRDSLDNLSLNTKIAEFETKYETAEKEKLIAQQDQELGKASNQRKLLIGGLAGVLWFGLFGILYFWSKNRFNKQLAARQIEVLEQEKKIMAVSSMLEGQETERSRIAQDLHDSIGGLLATVKAHFNVIQKEIDKISALEIGKKVEHLIDEASTEVRRISHKMSPRSLQLNGLQSALRDAAMELDSTSSLKVIYEWNGRDVKLDEGKEIMIYRMVQELITNVTKHADAKELLIQLNSFESGINIIIEDDGRGFTITDKESWSGLGLPGIRSRVDFMKGQVDIDSKKGEGTTVSIEIPL